MDPFSRVVLVEQTGSTNDDLVTALAGPGAGQWPHLSVLVAQRQVAGRGRSGRPWTSAGGSLTASVVVRSQAPLARWPWLSLLGGLAVARGITRCGSVATGLKWPNDVVVDLPGQAEVAGWGTGRKVAGVLVDVAAGDGTGPAPHRSAVLGLGVNLDQERSALPVPWATSLALAGVPAAGRSPQALLAAIGDELVPLLERWESAQGDATASGLLEDVAASCITLGRPVRVRLPGGREMSGTATALAPDGALILERDGAPAVPIAAGDVDHLRVATG